MSDDSYAIIYKDAEGSYVNRIYSASVDYEEDDVDFPVGERYDSIAEAIDAAIEMQCEYGYSLSGEVIEDIRKMEEQ